MRQKISARVDDERTVKRAQTGSEDPHRRERNITLFWFNFVELSNLVILFENKVSESKNPQYISVVQPCSVNHLAGQHQRQVEYNFRSRRRGSSLTVCTRLTVRSSPHRHERKFSGARVCRVTFKHLPQPLRSHIRSFGTIGQLFKIPPFSAQKSHSAGGRGGSPDIFF